MHAGGWVAGPVIEGGIPVHGHVLATKVAPDFNLNQEAFHHLAVVGALTTKGVDYLGRSQSRPAVVLPSSRPKSQSRRAS